MNSKHYDFICEIDKLKGVLRHTRLMDNSRRENSAEHSWHVAMMALIMTPKKDLNQNRILKMLLIHDIVEVDAGDTFIYDEKARQDKVAKEQQAAKRIFGLLPTEQAKEFQNLWEEFEAANTPEARYAKALDRMQPILHNIANKGGTWKEYGIKPQQILDVHKDLAHTSKELHEFLVNLLADAEKKGFFKKGPVQDNDPQVSQNT